MITYAFRCSHSGHPPPIHIRTHTHTYLHNRMPTYTHPHIHPQELGDLGSLSSMAQEWHIAGRGDAEMLERLSMLRDTSLGLRALHSKGIIHGDLVGCSLRVVVLG